MSIRPAAIDPELPTHERTSSVPVLAYEPLLRIRPDPKARALRVLVAMPVIYLSLLVAIRLLRQVGGGGNLFLAPADLSGDLLKTVGCVIGIVLGTLLLDRGREWQLNTEGITVIKPIGAPRQIPWTSIRSVKKTFGGVSMRAKGRWRPEILYDVPPNLRDAVIERWRATTGLDGSAPYFGAGSSTLTVSSHVTRRSCR